MKAICLITITILSLIFIKNPMMTPKKMYERTTSSIQAICLHDEIKSAIKNYEIKHQVKDLLANPVMCIKTESKKIKQGFFSKMMGKENKATPVYSIITDKWFLVVVWHELHIFVSLYQLGTFEITDYNYTLIPDNGIQIIGFGYGETGERGSYFVGLGPEQAAINFRAKMYELMKKQ